MFWNPADAGGKVEIEFASLDIEQMTPKKV
jgi:hypothetical protein